jgi:hypothetical protein
MRLTKSCLSMGIATLIAILFAAPLHSFADTYQIYNLGSDGGYYFDGMSSTGTVVFDSPYSPACGFSSNCYKTFSDGISAGVSSTAPTITDDNGTPCAPSDPGGWVAHGVCNNGLEAFTGTLGHGQIYPDVYVGSQQIFTGGEGFIFMNSAGDIVFDDQFNDDWYEAIDLSTPTPDYLSNSELPSVAPEPGGIFLLGTGLFALAILLRRRPSHS